MDIFKQLQEIENEFLKLSEIENINFREEVRRELNIKKHRLLNLLTFKNSLSNTEEKTLVRLLWDISKQSYKEKDLSELDFKTKSIISEIKKRNIILTISEWKHI